MWFISALNASEMLNGGRHRLELLSFSRPKSGSRHAQNLNFEWS
jgi:hypothetical protein